jgi:hypothetical protein
MIFSNKRHTPRQELDVIRCFVVWSAAKTSRREGGVPKVCSCWKAERTMLVVMKEREGGRESVCGCWFVV